jgi:tRNA1(Val) A37 N6-methylase TrmN6
MGTAMTVKAIRICQDTNAHRVDVDELLLCGNVAVKGIDERVCLVLVPSTAPQ